MSKRRRTRDNVINFPVKPSTDGDIGPKDYEYIQELLKEMRVQVLYQRQHLNKFLLDNYSLNANTISDSLLIRKNSIPDMSDEELRRFLTNHQIKDGIYNESSREELEKAMVSVKDAFIVLATSEKEFADIQKDADEVTREYYEFLNSTKTEEIREQRLHDMKMLNETIEDEIEKKKNSVKIEIIEKSYNYRFILERLEKYGQEEVERIIGVYFDRKNGSYMINRYEDKIQRLGFSSDIYQNFFNIEENFLPEEYHPFNNLFLCIYMYWLSHCDVNSDKDVLYAKSLTGGIANLIYHKFNEASKEENFIKLIREVLDYFMDKQDYFIENNDSYKNSPRRIQVEKEAREREISVFRSKFEEIGIGDKFDETKSVEEWRLLYNAEINSIIESQIKTPDNSELEENPIQNEDIESGKENIETLKESIHEGLNTITRKEKETLEKYKEEDKEKSSN